MLVAGLGMVSRQPPSTHKTFRCAGNLAGLHKRPSSPLALLLRSPPPSPTSLHTDDYDDGRVDGRRYASGVESSGGAGAFVVSSPPKVCWKVLTVGDIRGASSLAITRRHTMPVTHFDFGSFKSVSSIELLEVEPLTENVQVLSWSSHS